MGFTLHRPSADDLDNLLGFNFALLGGLGLAVHDHVGVFVEVGWRHRQVYDQVTILHEHDVTLRTDQAHVAAGVALRL